MVLNLLIFPFADQRQVGGSSSNFENYRVLFPISDLDNLPPFQLDTPGGFLV